MLDFSRLQRIEIPEGVVTQITDASGRVLWMLSGGKVILEVEKITSDTYAGETTYTGEQFILLDVYPAKSDSTIKVTYGGLTKTLTFTGSNAQQVFFGTFNGISDSVSTPASGTLTIEGGCKQVGVGAYKNGSKDLFGSYCGCVTAITDFGNLKSIPANAFRGCRKLKEVILLKGMNIPIGAFSDCTALQNAEIDGYITSPIMNADAPFYRCIALTNVTLGKNVSRVESGVFVLCKSLTNFIVDDNNRYYSTEGGILFNKTKTSINCYPSAKGSYVVPDSILIIEAHAFSNTDLTDITIPSSVNSVGMSAFSSCINVVSATVGAKKIDNYAFSFCANLKNLALQEGVEELGANTFDSCGIDGPLYIPSTVKSIGDSCFSGCINIGVYKMLGTVPPVLGENALEIDMNSELDSIFVPKGCAEIYKSAEGWSAYASKIKEAS